MCELDADEGLEDRDDSRGGDFFLSRGAEKDERSWNPLERDTAGAEGLWSCWKIGIIPWDEESCREEGSGRWAGMDPSSLCACRVSVVTLVTLW